MSEAPIENPLAVKRGPGRPPKIREENEDQQVTLSIKELRALISESKSEDNKTFVNALVDALRDIRKPYKSPEQEENDKMMAEQTRLMHERLRRTLEIDRQNCPHLQGSNALSEEQGTRLAIWWHRLDSGTWWGICSNCQREFWPSDTDYRQWRAKKSGNRPSQAGERQFVDTKAWEKKEHPRPFAAEVGA